MIEDEADGGPRWMWTVIKTFIGIKIVRGSSWSSWISDDGRDSIDNLASHFAFHLSNGKAPPSSPLKMVTLAWQERILV